MEGAFHRADGNLSVEEGARCLFVFLTTLVVEAHEPWNGPQLDDGESVEQPVPEVLLGIEQAADQRVVDAEAGHMRQQVQYAK